MKRNSNAVGIVIVAVVLVILAAILWLMVAPLAYGQEPTATPTYIYLPLVLRSGGGPVPPPAEPTTTVAATPTYTPERR